MTISKPIEKAPTVKEDLLMASETAAEEAQLELDQLLQQFEKWSETNTGGWKDFLKDTKEDFKPKRIKLGSGGVTGDTLAEDYGDLIDAWVKKIDVLENESLTDYINRVSKSEAKND